MSADPAFSANVPVSSWRDCGPTEHFVQFYADDAVLEMAVVEYAANAFHEGAVAIVVATAQHLAAFERRWVARGIDLESARDHGHYVPLEAEETLGKLLHDGWPRSTAFSHVIEPVVARAAERGRQVYAFGEMVALLWRKRQFGAAIQLEALWNELARKHRFALFCAYPLEGDQHAPSDALHQVCAAHAKSIPTESYTALPSPAERLAAICELQNKALLLERELADRKRLERQLARRELELSDFLENGIDALHTVGRDGTILWANRAELELLGYAAEEYFGRNVREFHADAEAIESILSRLLAGETLRNVRARLRCKDGSIKHVSISTNGRWEDGSFKHTRCFTRDITAQVYAEEAQKEADRRKDEFLALLAHELRNPLAPIRYALATAKKAERTPEQARRADEIIERQVAHMSRLLDDLLDVSRITRGTLELRKAKTELTAVIATAIESARPVLDKKRHVLTVHLPDHPVRLDADAVRLSQVFSNLLINAGKYTDPGGQIELRAEVEGDRVVVRVRDNGIGISAEMLPRLFTMFSQAEGALTRSDGGLGIGLALARGLVELHEGTVTAHSDGSGLGSEFVVSLPLGVATENVADLDRAEAAMAARRLRVLVVDDNRDSAAMCGAFVQSCGHDVRVVYAGTSALAAADEYRPDVIILDIGMPELDGYEVARQLRARESSRTPILIAITGWGQDRDKSRAIEAGFDYHLTKPVDPADLEPLLVGAAL
jgi:PAS domain S-box-containing protein